jgi:putative membrane protein
MNSKEAAMDWNNGWSWMWMGLMMILFWGGLIVLVALLLRVGRFGGRKDQTDTPARGPDTTEILRARFARGEITEDEYRKSLTVLDETKR